MRTRTGTVSQSALRHDEADYAHERIAHPVLGIILNVYLANDPQNRSAQITHEGRGSQIEARVLVMNDGTDSPWIIPNAVVLPRGSSGFDNFEEEIPKGVTGSIDDEKVPANFTDISPQKLDGDWCVVGFIGGSINQPFVAHWWPHPSNQRDTTTSGSADFLRQSRRWAKRFQGTRLTMTSKGTVLLDTSEANSKLKNGKRLASDLGGDIRLTVKESKEMELNWNASVYGDPNEEDFLWEPKPQKKVRSTTNTKVRFTKDEIEAIAGAVINLQAKNDATGTVNVKADHVNLGSATAPEQLVLGNTFKTSDDTLSTAFDIWVKAVNTVISADPMIPGPVVAAFGAACTAFESAINQYKSTNILSDVSKTR
jgi:hypothetical protein